MIKVAFDLTSAASSPFGGIATVCRETARQAIAHDEIEPTGYFRRGSRGAVDLSNIDFHRFSLFHALFSSRYDIVHSLCHRKLPVRGKKHVYTVYDAWSLIPNKYQSADYQQKIGQRMRKDFVGIDRIVTISESTRTALLANSDLRPEQVETIMLGVEIPNERVLTPTDSSMLSIPTPFVLFVGRLEYRKNLQHVCNAVAPLEKMHLVVVGEPGHGYEESALPALTAFPKDRIHRYQTVDQRTLGWLYRRALALVAPSWEEGFGLPILEAMSHGCPVITSDISACAELARGAGLLVSPDNARETTDHVNRLMSNTAHYSEISDACLARAKQLSWRAHMDTLVALYKRLLA